MFKLHSNFKPTGDQPEAIKTLAEGVNMLIKTLILCHLTNPADYKTYISIAKIKNIIGRVGRTGKEIYGNHCPV